MGTGHDDEVPLTKEQSSVTQETKARFEELLDNALKNGTSHTARTPLRKPKIKNKRNTSSAVVKTESSATQLVGTSSSEDSNSFCIPIGNRVNSGERSKNQLTLLAEIHNSNKANEKHNFNSLALSPSEDLLIGEEELLIGRSKLKPDLVTARKQRKDNSCVDVNSIVKSEKNSSSRVSEQVEKLDTVVKKFNDPMTRNNSAEHVDSISEEDGVLVFRSTVTPADNSNTGTSRLCVKKPVPLPRSRSRHTSPECDSSTDNYRTAIRNKESTNKKCSARKDRKASFPSAVNDTRVANNSNSIQSSSNEIEHCDDDRDSIKKKRVKKKRSLRKRSSHETVKTELVENKTCVSNGTTTASSVETLENETCSDERNTSKQNILDDMIFGVTVHCTDILQQHPLLQHPLVTVYIVNSTTGQLIDKSDPGRPASFYQENVSYILPIMTHSYDLKRQRSLVPAWEELLVFNESISHLVVPETVIFFEVVDFVSFASGSVRYRRLGHNSGWHRIAWAFLKLIAANGETNTQKQLRLQLYYPKNKRANSSETTAPTVYRWWKEGLQSCCKYPSTLYVTVGRVAPPQTPLAPNLRSRVVLQYEQGSVADVLQKDIGVFGEKTTQRSKLSDDRSECTQTPITWSRLPAQSCKLVNCKHAAIPIFPSGGLCVEFSHNGLSVACATPKNIQVFDVPHFKSSTIITGHQGLIYKLKWSVDDACLISSSTDCTARIWHLRKKNLCPQVLAHPSFVYCADFVPHHVRRSVVTGCCDGNVRIWVRDKSASYRLAQEMPGHNGFISALCCSTIDVVFYTGDSLGVIKMWRYDNESGEWSCARDIKIREVKGVVINNLMLHAGGNRMLMHTRDSVLRMVDLLTYAVIQWFHGCRNDRLQMNSVLTPCGGMLLSCSEDGLVCAWDSNTGDQLGLYEGLMTESCSAAVAYHPLEHMMAIVCYRNGTTTTDDSPQHLYIICNHDRCKTSDNVGLKRFQVPNNKEHAAKGVKERIKKCKTSDNLWQKLEALSIERMDTLVSGVSDGIVHLSGHDGDFNDVSSGRKRNSKRKGFSDRIDHGWAKLSNVSGFLVDHSVTLARKHIGGEASVMQTDDYDGTKCGQSVISPRDAFSGRKYNTASVLSDVLKRMDKVLLESTTAESRM